MLENEKQNSLTWCYCCCSRSQLNRMSSLRLLFGDNVTYTNFQEWNRPTNEKTTTKQQRYLPPKIAVSLLRIKIYTVNVWSHTNRAGETERVWCVNWNGTNKNFTYLYQAIEIVCVHARVFVRLWMLIYFGCFSRQLTYDQMCSVTPMVYCWLSFSHSRKTRCFINC